MPTSVVATELYLSTGDFQEDKNKVGSIVRTWRVNVADTVVARTAPELPPLNSVHPSYPAMRLQNFTSRTDNGTSIVQAQYTTGQFGFLRISDRTGTRFGFDYKTVEVEIPMFYVGEITVAGSTETTPAWFPVPFKSRETRVVYTAKVVIPNITPNQILSVANQNNVIHTIRGADYLFTAGTVLQIEDDKFELEYRWEYDRGTPFVEATNTNISVPPQVETTGLCRLPYERLIARQTPNSPAPGTPGQEPTYERQVLYIKIEDGWMSLPGELNL